MLPPWVLCRVGVGEWPVRQARPICLSENPQLPARVLANFLLPFLHLLILCAMGGTVLTFTCTRPGTLPPSFITWDEG